MPGRKDLLLLVLGVDGGSRSEGVNGITRLQKFLFLLENEHGVKGEGDGFAFEAYKAGPYSPKLYDDLEFLENLGLIESAVTSAATEAEAAEIDALNFDDLMDEDDNDGDSAKGADSQEERCYRLTMAGQKHLEKLLQDAQNTTAADAVKTVKGRYGKYTLNDLLYHVYTKFPDMTTASEIKDKVLSRKGKKK